MKYSLVLLPTIAAILLGCSTVNQMNALVNSSTDSINANREAVESSTAVVRENKRLIDQSNQVIAENRAHLETELKK